MHVLVADLWRGKLRHHGWRVAAVGAAAVQSPSVALHRHLHHTNSTPQLYCTAKCVTVQAQIFMQLPAPHKQHTSVILHCKMCHSTGSDIYTVTCTTQTAHLSYSALQNVSHYMLRYSSSYLQPQKQHTSVILHCKMCHTQIFLQLPAALEHCAYIGDWFICWLQSDGNISR